jgi:hypothetical protein
MQLTISLAVQLPVARFSFLPPFLFSELTNVQRRNSFKQWDMLFKSLISKSQEFRAETCYVLVLEKIIKWRLRRWCLRRWCLRRP